MAFQCADFSLEDEDGITVVTFQSQRLADEQQLDRIKSGLCELVKSGVRRLVLDFTHVRYINSAFLGVLIVLHNKMPDHHRYRTHRERNWEVFEITRDRRTAIDDVSGDECDPLVLCGVDDALREIFVIC